MSICYLGLGSNLSCPRRQLTKAIAHLRHLPQSRIIQISALYFSEPMGVRAQPPYFNLVIKIQTTLPADKLLHYCQLIEHKQKRVRKRHWGARTLDIDILFYGERHIKTKKLIIPHPGVQERHFVKVPLLTLSPNNFVREKACLEAQL